MLKTNEKPILANQEALIPEEKSLLMPRLVVTSMETNRDVTFPDDLIRQNRLKDPTAQCTLVALSFRQFGYAMIPPWLNPAREIYGDNSRVQILQINMSEGGWLFRIMSPLLKWMIYQNTSPQERHYTYLFFGKNDDDDSALSNFQIKLGFHNVMTCFVFLLDGVGQIRWVASGHPTDEELHSLLHKHIPQLLPRTPPQKGKLPGRKS